MSEAVQLRNLTSEAIELVKQYMCMRDPQWQDALYRKQLHKAYKGIIIQQLVYLCDTYEKVLIQQIKDKRYNSSKNNVL